MGFRLSRSISDSGSGFADETCAPSAHGPTDPGIAVLAPHLVAFLLVCVTLAVPTVAMAGALHPRRAIPASLTLLVSAAGTAVCAYLAFWGWFFSPAAGVTWTAIVIVGAGLLLWRNRPAVRAALADAHFWQPLALMSVIGVGYIGTLQLFATGLDVESLAANRFIPGLPADNVIPRLFAERLINDADPRRLLGDWLSSDRPPLQTGFVLLCWPVLQLTGIDLGTVALAAGMWFQLLWVPAVWGWSMRLRADRKFATVAVALMAMTSVCLLHSVYVWPKLGAAALVVGAFLVYADAGARDRASLVLAGVLAALAWLAHGGVAFSLVALALLAIFWRPWPRPGAVLLGGLAALMLMAPWIAYQKFYEPPGNRLLKWHLAGVIPPDERGVGETLATAYRETGWIGTWRHKVANLRTIIEPDLPLWTAFDDDSRGRRRQAEFFGFSQSLGFWSVGFLLAPALWWRRRKKGARTNLDSTAFVGSVWVGATLVVWALLMFSGGTTVIHQGSFATHLVLFPLLFAVAAGTHPLLYGALVVMHCLQFRLVWLPASPTSQGAIVPGAAVAIAITAALLAAWCASSLPAAPVAGGARPPVRRYTRHLVWIAMTLLVLLGPGGAALATRLQAIPEADSVPRTRAFQAGGYYPATPRVPHGLATAGSWLGADQFQGAHESDWYSIDGTFSIFVAGYPTRGANRLEAVFKFPSGDLKTIPYSDSDPHETWRTWEIVPPEAAVAVRFRAVDQSSEPGGWLAFSEPFRLETRAWRGWGW